VPRVLLDESVPRPVLRAFPKGKATTVDLLGWKGIKNGSLLLRAEAQGFEVLITSDKSMADQNDLSNRQLAGLVLPHANWPKLRGMLDKIAAAVTGLPPGTFTQLPPGR
jgi:hypothetical protein